MNDTPRCDAINRTDTGAWINLARQLERELAEANSLIYDIAHYPIHSEPMGGAMDMQDRAFNFLAKHPAIDQPKTR